MSSQQTRRNNKGYKNRDLAAQSPKSDDVEDMLASVDQFIERVYRDLSLSPPRRSSMGNSTSSRPLDTSDSSISLTATSPAVVTTTTSRRETSPVYSPVTRRNMDAEIERINRICDNVDQNLRSVGLYMNSGSSSSLAESLSNTNITDTPISLTTSVIIVDNTSPSSASAVRRTSQQNKSPREIAAESVIDLSNSQVVDTSEIVARPPSYSHNDDNDDDVILVSANLPQVVDLCTPSTYQPRHSMNYENLNRRRLHEENVVNDLESSWEEASSSKKCRNARSLSPSDNSCRQVDETEKTNNNGGRTPFMCPVCMESCLQRQPTSTVCGHVFCRQCIRQAIILNRKCPMCNKRINTKQTFRIYL